MRRAEIGPLYKRLSPSVLSTCRRRTSRNPCLRRAEIGPLNKRLSPSVFSTCRRRSLQNQRLRRAEIDPPHKLFRPASLTHVVAGRQIKASEGITPKAPLKSTNEPRACRPTTRHRTCEGWRGCWLQGCGGSLQQSAARCANKWPHCSTTVSQGAGRGAPGSTKNLRSCSSTLKERLRQQKILLQELQCVNVEAVAFIKFDICVVLNSFETNILLNVVHRLIKAFV